MKPGQALAKLNSLLRECDANERKELEGVTHVNRIGPLPPGRASTILTECADDCPACAIGRKYSQIRTQIGKLQRRVLLATGSAALATNEQLALARSARKCPYTADEHDAAELLARGKKIEMARVLSVDVKTLRKYGRPK